MSDELLHLTPHETVRIVRATADELEVKAKWMPGSSAPPAHLHPNQDEIFEVISGRLSAVVAGERRELGPGERLRVPRGTPHKMWNESGEATTAIWRTRPGGRTLEWFRTIDRLGDHGRRRPPTPALLKAVASYSDVFEPVVGPGALRPVVGGALRVLRLADRK
jgi:mannose-6-phosphate isomerase-like protein (cupin superfamily)